MSVHSSLIATHWLEFAMDFGHFVISGAPGADEGELLERALSAPPSVSGGGSVLVLSPHQNNFALPLTVEIWNSDPAPDRDDWQQVSEESIVVDDRGSIYFESPTLDGVACPVAPGEYVLETSGRGFVGSGWPGSTEPGDEWRVRLWPSSGSPRSRPKIFEN